MRRTYRTLNDYEMQHNAEVGLFTRPSSMSFAIPVSPPLLGLDHVLNLFVFIIRDHDFC
jgi:hypothetical protein